MRSRVLIPIPEDPAATRVSRSEMDRVIRGGCWIFTARCLHAACWHASAHRSRLRIFGSRVVLEVR